MNTNKYIRVLLADDHTLFRNGIISLLENEKDIFVVGEVDNGKDLLNKYLEIMPDLVLLDISMPGKSGLEAAKEIKQNDHKAKLLFLSMHEEDEYIYYCLKAGGMGLINKNIWEPGNACPPITTSLPFSACAGAPMVGGIKTFCT